MKLSTLEGALTLATFVAILAATFLTYQFAG